MRILVTGAAGYLGGHVVDRLAREGHTVTALVREPSRLGPWLASRAQVQRCDLARELAPRSLEGHDACVHLAVLWPETGAFPELGDVGASVRLFDALGHARVGHVLYVSSVAVHRPFTARMTEHDRLVTADAYGAAKASGEHFLHASAEAHGFRASVVRPGPCVGLHADPEVRPRTPNAITEILEALRAARPVQVTEGEGRQLTACADVAEAIARMLQTPDAPTPLVCVSRAITPWAEIAQRLAVRLGCERLVEVLPRDGLGAPPSFDTTCLEAWLGRHLDARPALEAHLATLLGA